MTAQDFKKTVLTHMQEVLKPERFRKKQSLFWLEHDDVVLFVQLQSSRMSTKDYLRATVNLGIFSKTVAEAVGNTHEPNIYEAHWDQRIGQLFPAPHDKWWHIHKDKDAELAGREIAAFMKIKALPVMEGLASTDSLKALWETGRSPGQTDFQRQEYLRALGARV